MADHHNRRYPRHRTDALQCPCSSPGVHTDRHPLLQAPRTQPLRPMGNDHGSSRTFTCSSIAPQPDGIGTCCCTGKLASSPAWTPPRQQQAGLPRSRAEHPTRPPFAPGHRCGPTPASSSRPSPTRANRALLDRSVPLLDSDRISAQSRQELTSIVYRLRADGLTGTGTGR
jgi:hypothetical protein